MSVRYMNPPGYPLPAGRFSHVAIAEPGRLAFIAGQVAVDGEGVLQAPGDAGAQFPIVFENVLTVARSMGCGPTDIVEFTTYLVGDDALEKWRAARIAVYDRCYGDGAPPPNTLLVVSGLVDPDMRVEISAVVRLPDQER